MHSNRKKLLFSEKFSDEVHNQIIWSNFYLNIRVLYIIKYFVILPFIISAALFVLRKLLIVKGEIEKLRTFQCGFDSQLLRRLPFSTYYFLLVLLFLVFDVELALLLPFVVTFLNTQNILWIVVVLVVLLVALFYEINEGSLQWVKDIL